MKKLMTLAALVAACAPAFTAEVTSSNTVGYQKIATSANMNIIAAQFQAVGGGKLSIQDLVGDEDFDPNGGDWIRIYDPQERSYTLAAWWPDGVWAPGADEEDDPIADHGWGTTDGTQTVIDIDIDPSQGFWAQSRKSATILAAGEVSPSNTVTVLAGKMMLVANPFPVDVDIQDIVAGDTFDANGGDWIRVYDAGERTYTLAAWWPDGVWAPGADEEDDPIADHGWGTTDGTQTVINHTVLAGQGFWVQSRNGGTLTFPNPTAPAAAQGGND